MNRAGLRLVRDEIEKAVANPQCPHCRSTRVKDREMPGPRRATWRFKVCLDCDLAYDADLDR